MTGVQTCALPISVGTSCYERAVLGLPSVTLSIADNQNEVAQRLNDAGVILHLGKEKNVSKELITYNLDNLTESDWLEGCSLVCSKLFDGKIGPELLIEELRVSKVI